MSDGEITIDTNVFEHVFNTQINADGHVDALLRCLVEKRVALGHDDKDRIFGEYRIRLLPLMKTKSDQGHRIFWLRYLLELAERRPVTIKFGDALMVRIRGTIRNAEPSDHVFVYVAISLDSILVSNDQHHITGHRIGLRQCARAHGRTTTDFVNSKDALPIVSG